MAGRGPERTVWAVLRVCTPPCHAAQSALCAAKSRGSIVCHQAFVTCNRNLVQKVSEKQKAGHRSAPLGGAGHFWALCYVTSCAGQLKTAVRPHIPPSPRSFSRNAVSSIFGFDPRSRPKEFKRSALGSRLIDNQSQNKTVAARAMADRKTFGHLS